MEDYQRALAAYDSALFHNPYSVAALSAMASVYRALDHFEAAVDCFQRALNIVPENGVIWGAMGHCYLMMDDLQKAYTAYQQALYHLPNPNEPKLWYGIGILYDRYGSLEHAEEAFSSVIRMNPSYEKANEIYFRLGIIYKQQGQFEPSLECFRYILNNPPRPLTEMDIHFQIGLVYEQQSEFALAKEVYERVLAETPNHAKVLQQLGWLYLQPATGFVDHVLAVKLLSQSLESDPNDPQSWYLLGRAYVSAEDYNEAYEAYQQGLYRDNKNPVLWCSIGILYYQIDQFRDALGAYSRSIRLNPYIPEVWLNLGILYESSNNQVNDAIDAYQRALELDPENEIIKQRLHLLDKAQKSGEPLPPAPAPQDVHPSAYTTAVLPPEEQSAEVSREEDPRGAWHYEDEAPNGDPRDRARESSYYEQRGYRDVRDMERRPPLSNGRYEDLRYNLRLVLTMTGVATIHMVAWAVDLESSRISEPWHNSYRREDQSNESFARPYGSSREIDENYDDGAASSLMGLAGAAASMVEAEERNKANAGALASAAPLPNPALDAVVSAPRQPVPDGASANSGKYVLEAAEDGASKPVARTGHDNPDTTAPCVGEAPSAMPIDSEAHDPVRVATEPEQR
ncbi:glucose repression mediator protein [Malassezia cuniculi]|uniref:Glucose repression mediator protein n=1 Tax=Malassezia cuniculi TaxID=948313 RepID=A0AAF0ER36_9BASI|nr:glucose repression mediator protein [Malassezia cuniculi]